MSDLSTEERLAAVQMLQQEYRRMLAMAVARKQLIEQNPHVTDAERGPALAALQRDIDSLEWMATEAGARLKKSQAALDGAEIAEGEPTPLKRQAK